MKTEKNTIKTESCFSDDMEHRFYIKKSWNAKKSSALVIMLSAGSCDGLTLDYSTLYCVNNLVKLDYGSVVIMNLFSEVGKAISVSQLEDKEVIKTNNDKLLEMAEKVDTIIFAYGRAGRTNKVVKQRINQVTELLLGFNEKYILSDAQGRVGFHPLAPTVRTEWYLHKISNSKSIET